MLSSLSPNFQIVEDVYTTLALGTQLFFFIRWTLSRIEHYKATQVFIEQMKSNHLPHIYRNLRAICDKLDIKFSEPEPEDE